ncbi:hypothetical protein PINS_up000445 [Pythium insidiosum]|nr:hypothetical protein PINS_up000445 [Pythium insidiosum]
MSRSADDGEGGAQSARPMMRWVARRSEDDDGASDRGLFRWRRGSSSDVLPPPSSTSEASTVSNPRDVSFLAGAAIEDYVAKYQVIKCSWRGKYERLLALGPTRFCTLDPKDFEVTNTWPLSAVLDVTLEPGDAEGFVLHLKGPKKDEQLKLRCRFRSWLLSDLFRLLDRAAGGNRASLQQQRVPCSKTMRRGGELEGLMEIGQDCVSFLATDGVVRSSYQLVEMEYLASVTDHRNAFVFGYGGRPRMFSSDRGGQIVGQIKSAAEKLGLTLLSRPGLTTAAVREERARYGQNVGKPFVQFMVTKMSRKYSTPVPRKLSLHQKHVVELDVEDNVVSCVEYSKIYALTRTKKTNQFDIQFLHGSSVHYISEDRDGVLAALYDLCVTCNQNPDLFITSATNDRGLRLLPCFATEDKAETHSFFGDSSIGTCFLQRMTAVGKLGSSQKSSDRAFIEIVREFNANVPASGILYDAKQATIVDALRPLGSQLYYVSKGKPIPSGPAVDLVQALFRIASSFYGFREVAKISHLTDSITNLLVNGDELVVFWTTLLLGRLTSHAPIGTQKLDAAVARSCEEVELQNKAILFGNTYLIQSLVAHLEAVDIQGRTNSSKARRRVGPLVIMGMLQTLEGALCSRRNTTGATEFQEIVAEIAKHYSTLLKVLFQSRCATTVEACTLLLKTTLEECDPSMASQIRDAALAEGIVLRHFYQALFDTCYDQRAVSRYLISLWMSNHPASKDLLLRMIPRGFMTFLTIPAYSAAELAHLEQVEREQLSVSARDDTSFSTDSDDVLSAEGDWSLSNDGAPPLCTSPDADCHAISSESAESDSSRSVQLQERVSETRPSLFGSTPASTRESINGQIESVYTKARMLQKLQSSRTTQRVSGSVSERDTQMMSRHIISEASSRRRKRDIAMDFITNAISKTNSDRPTELKVRRTSKSKQGTSKKARVSENFPALFSKLICDHETVHLIWNHDTRGELKMALLAEIQRFNEFQVTCGSGKAVWNFEDFRVEYPSLETEIEVGGCYLRVLCDLPKMLSSGEGSTTLETRSSQDTFKTLTPEVIGIVDPKFAVDRMYRRILRENVHAEYHHELRTHVACIDALTIVGGAYSKSPGLTDLDEVDYLVNLLDATIHSNVLHALLRALRALCLAPSNARRLVETPSTLSTVIDLLQLSHLSNRDVERRQTGHVWFLETKNGVALGSRTVSEIASARRSGEIDTQTILVRRVDTTECRRGDERLVPLGSIKQLRWEIILGGHLDALQIAYDSINILLSVVNSNSLRASKVDFHLGPLYPSQRSKIELWKQVHRFVSVLGLYEHPHLFEKIGRLLNIMYENPEVLTVLGDDMTHRSLLREMGVFYLSFVADTLNFEDIAGLLKNTHRHQNCLSGESALTGILPDAMIDFLDVSTPHEFAQVFNGNIASPEVIWSREMRLYLRNCAIAHLQEYFDVLQEDVSSEWRYCPMAQVAYAELQEELWCGGVYLGKYCARSDYPIDNPTAFVDRLISAWRAETDRHAALYTTEEAAHVLGIQGSMTADADSLLFRKAFKDRAREIENPSISTKRLSELDEAYRVLTAPRPSLLTEGHDPVNLLLILSALVETCNRYPKKLRDYRFDCYDLLLPLLKSHCTADGVPPAFTSDDQQAEIAVCAAELLFNSCALSMQNSDVLLRRSDLGILEEVINFCVNTIIDEPYDHDGRLDRVCFFTLQTITGLLASQDGRVWVSQSTTLLIDMVRLLWAWNHRNEKAFLLSKITQQVLESISRMTLLEVNQDLLMANGVIWQLLLLFSQYDVSLDDTSALARLQASFLSTDGDYDAVAREIDNVLGVMAIRAICRLGGYFPVDHELFSPRNALVHSVLNSLFTPNLAKLLSLRNHHEFLKIFHGDCESYTLYWNAEMRKELFEYVTSRGDVQPQKGCSEDFDGAISLRFNFLSHVFAIDDIYIDTLASSLLVVRAGDIELPKNLGLHEDFFVHILQFIETGKLQISDHTAQAPNRPFSGWGLSDDELQTNCRAAALSCVAAASEVIPLEVEKHLEADTSLIKMILRMLFPADNEVHCSDGTDEDPLVFPLELYGTSSSDALRILESLSKMDSFGRAAHSVGICDILIEVVHQCRHIGPNCLSIIRNLCRAGAQELYVNDIMNSGSYLEFFGWLVVVEEPQTDDDVHALEALRRPSAEVLGELGQAHREIGLRCFEMLKRMLPVPVAEALISHPSSFVDFLTSDHETPELVWGETARIHMRNHIIQFLTEYYEDPEDPETNGVDTNVDDATGCEKITDRFGTHSIDYSGTCSNPCVAGVYLDLYMKEPTFTLRDPQQFASCLWMEFEIFIGELAHLTSSLRQTRSPDDDMLAEQDESLLNLVTSCLVCAMRMNPWVLDSMADSKIPEKCCNYLNQCVRNNASDTCNVCVVRLLRVFSTSRKCVATVQPYCSTLLTCLLAQINPSRRGPLHHEAAFVLEIIRRIVMNFPSTISNGEGIVTVAIRIDIFGYLLRILDSPGAIGLVRDPHLLRGIAIDILNMLEKDRLQSRTAHEAMRKHKKWEKQYRHERIPIPYPAYPEDPFLASFGDTVDTRVTEAAKSMPASRPTPNTNVASAAGRPLRVTMLERARDAPPAETSSQPLRLTMSQNGGGAKEGRYRNLFRRR